MPTGRFGLCPGGEAHEPRFFSSGHARSALRRGPKKAFVRMEGKKKFPPVEVGVSSLVKALIKKWPIRTLEYKRSHRLFTRRQNKPLRAFANFNLCPHAGSFRRPWQAFWRRQDASPCACAGAGRRKTEKLYLRLNGAERATLLLKTAPFGRKIGAERMQDWIEMRFIALRPEWR